MLIRILHIISSVNPKDGGPVENVKQFALEGRRIGCLSEVVCVDDSRDEWVKNFGVPCHAVGGARLGTYSYSGNLVPWLRKNAKKYDAVIVHGIWQYHSYGAWLALRGLDVPYFVFPHGMLDPWFKRRYPWKHLKKWLFWPWSVYPTLRDASGVLFTCEEERRLARDSFFLYRCHEKVVSFGTTEPPSSDRDVDRQKAVFSSAFPSLVGKRKILFLGRVHEKKGSDLILKALANIRKKNDRSLDQVQLIMAGPDDHAYGHEMKRLAEKLNVSDLVTWTGMIQGDLKWGAFRSAEAFILPSHQENFGIAVVEALACSVPVLISRAINIWRDIDQAGACYVDDDDVEGAERLIARWLATDKRVWEDMSIRARKCFFERFSAERAAQSLVNIVQNSLKEVGGR